MQNLVLSTSRYSIGKCLIWDTLALIMGISGYDRYQVKSDRAGGTYQISRSAAHNLEFNDSPNFKIKLTSWLVKERLNGNDNPYIDTSVLDQILTRNVLDYSKRIENFFRGLNLITPRIGGSIRILDEPKFALKFDSAESNDEAGTQYIHSYEIAAWIEARTTEFDEVWNFIQHLHEQGLVITERGNLDEYYFVIRPRGWSYIESLIKPVKKSDKAFVAMWFDPSLNDVFKTQFEKALEACGFVAPFRIDQHHHTGKVDDEIIAKIKQSSLVVVDLTCRLNDRPFGIEGNGKVIEARGGVYFEAGFAMGLQIPIVWTCRQDCLSGVHFDTRQYPLILWYPEGDHFYVDDINGKKTLLDALVNRIDAVKKAET